MRVNPSPSHVPPYFIDDPTELQPREPALVAIRWKQNSTNSRWRCKVRHLETEVDVARRRGVLRTACNPTALQTRGPTHIKKLKGDSEGGFMQYSTCTREETAVLSP